MDVPLIGGVAGGVGTTTLARALHAIDGGIYPGAAPVDVLVARSTMHSPACAQRAVAATPTPPILAVVADVPRAPLSGRMKARMRMTEPYLAGLVVVPFVEAWPELDDPYEDAEQVLSAGGAAQAAAGLPTALRRWSSRSSRACSTVAARSGTPPTRPRAWSRYPGLHIRPARSGDASTVRAQPNRPPSLGASFSKRARGAFARATLR